MVEKDKNKLLERLIVLETQNKESKRIVNLLSGLFTLIIVSVFIWGIALGKDVTELQNTTKHHSESLVELEKTDDKLKDDVAYAKNKIGNTDIHLGNINKTLERIERRGGIASGKEPVGIK